MKLLIYPKTLAFILISILIGCKDKKKEDPQPQEPQIVEVVHIKEVILRNQYTVDPEVWFYKIHDDAYSANKDADFDLAFIYYVPSAGLKYLIGSPAHPNVQSTYKTSSNYFTRFFLLPEFKSANFDTLRNSEVLPQIIENGEVVLNAFGTAPGIPSNETGWDPGYVFGIQTEKGKYGVVRVKTAPTGNLNIPGFITLEIKIQPQSN